MQIVDRKTFLALPVGTVYSKLPLDNMTYDFGPIEIKGETCGENDWFVQQLIGDFTDTSGSDDWCVAFEELLGGGQRFIDYDIQGRDGLFDEKQRFAVFNRQDHEALIERLSKALRGAE